MITQSSFLKKSQYDLRNGLFLGLLFLQTGLAGAQEFATNPGFETGNTTGWFAFGSPAISARRFKFILAVMRAS